MRWGLAFSGMNYRQSQSELENVHPLLRTLPWYRSVDPTGLVLECRLHPVASLFLAQAYVFHKLFEALFVCVRRRTVTIGNVWG